MDWPAYESTPLFDRTSLPALESDVRVVAETWFDHGKHEAAEPFVSTLPLAYVRFDAHDQYTSSTSYEMETLFRLFVLKELYGWGHETALVEYLTQQPDLCERLGLESVPNQSTLWRSWHHRFTADLRNTVKTAARTILIKAQNAGISVPREPERQSRRHGDKSRESDPGDQVVLEQAETVTEHVSRIAFPTFSLDRGEGCEIHENAYWDLQTYLGLRENLAVNEGAWSFIHESNRNRTPLGHAHREHIHDLSIEQIRTMYRQAIRQLIDEVAETEEFFRAGIVAVDITEADPFTGDRTGHEDEIIGTKEQTESSASLLSSVELLSAFWVGSVP
nr:transposase [Halohasta litorea]